MPTNTKLLKGRIVEKGYTDGRIADLIGVSRQTFCKKINNQADFKASEIVAICNLLEIDEKDKYFFVTE